jgi:hypothetical protein
MVVPDSLSAEWEVLEIMHVVWPLLVGPSPQDSVPQHQWKAKDTATKATASASRPGELGLGSVNPRFINGFRALWDAMVRITVIEKCIYTVLLKIIPFPRYIQSIEHIICLPAQPLDTTQRRWVMEWSWRKPPRKVSYKRTFGAPDQGQTLDLWESQTTESALRWQTCHIAPRHILELTHEVILEVILEFTLEVILELTLEVILEHVLGVKNITSLILDHLATAYLYLGINTREIVMILFLVIVLELSQDQSWSIKHALQSFLL